MPASTTLRITDGCEGKVETLIVKIMAFELSVEEARANPDVVMSMFSIYSLFYYFLC